MYKYYFFGGGGVTLENQENKSKGLLIVRNHTHCGISRQLMAEERN